MCDVPIETVKYIWVNILYMLDWIFSQNCKNSLPLHTRHDASGTAGTAAAVLEFFHCLVGFSWCREKFYFLYI